MTPAIGSVWESLDPRDEGRRVRVTAIIGRYVSTRNVHTNRYSRIHIDRFDGRQWLRV